MPPPRLIPLWAKAQAAHLLAFSYSTRLPYRDTRRHRARFGT
jgi:hypothetical protein